MSKLRYTRRYTRMLNGMSSGAQPSLSGAASEIVGEVFACGLDRPAEAVPAIQWGGWLVDVVRDVRDDRPGELHAVACGPGGDPIPGADVRGPMKYRGGRLMCGPYAADEVPRVDGERGADYWPRVAAHIEALAARHVEVAS